MYHNIKKRKKEEKHEKFNTNFSKFLLILNSGKI